MTRQYFLKHGLSKNGLLFQHSLTAFIWFGLMAIGGLKYPKRPSISVDWLCLLLSIIVLLIHFYMQSRNDFYVNLSKSPTHIVVHTFFHTFSGCAMCNPVILAIFYCTKLIVQAPFSRFQSSVSIIVPSLSVVSSQSSTFICMSYTLHSWFIVGDEVTKTSLLSLVPMFCFVFSKLVFPIFYRRADADSLRAMVQPFIIFFYIVYNLALESSRSSSAACDWAVRLLV